MNGLFEQQTNERNASTEAILGSRADKKVVVSGPGTGKTFLFNQIFNARPGNNLALTFINNLASKLGEELGGKARCCTFHKFCTALLYSFPTGGITTNFSFYPKLSLLIKSDAHVLGHAIDFRHCFKRLERGSEALRFFINQANYYDAVAFDDSVYRVLTHFEANPTDIPTFDQIVVDEYQDFNMLEVTFLDLLAAKNNILIVGDDDQALYGQLKDANPEFIRQKYNGGIYTKFQLPFCSRCTEIVVGAVNDIVTRAKGMSMLSGRVNKRYICFLPDKFNDSKKYPTIEHVYCSVQTKTTPYISRFIEQQIRKLTPKEILDINEKADFTVLITGPKHYLEQVHHYFRNVKDFIMYADYKKQEAGQTSLQPLEGYERLLRNPSSNLGWRILCEAERLYKFSSILNKATDNNRLLKNLLPTSFVAKHESVLSLLGEMQSGHDVTPNDIGKIEEITGRCIVDIRQWLENLSTRNEPVSETRDKTKLSIILTTYVGCKGLSAGFVFALGMNEGCLPVRNNSPSDIEICQFIVILTRTTKKCHLITCGRFSGQPAGRPSLFINWINSSRISRTTVDRNYW